MSASEPETAAQWWERVRAEHGPAPERVQDVWRAAVQRTVAREQASRGAS